MKIISNFLKTLYLDYVNRGNEWYQFQKYWKTYKKKLVSLAITPHRTSIISTLLDNQFEYANRMDGLRDSDFHLQKAMIDMVPHIINHTTAFDLVGVQPMTRPAELVYRLAYEKVQNGGDIKCALRTLSSSLEAESRQLVRVDPMNPRDSESFDNIIMQIANDFNREVLSDVHALAGGIKSHDLFDGDDIMFDKLEELASGISSATKHRRPTWIAIPSSLETLFIDSDVLEFEPIHSNMRASSQHNIIEIGHSDPIGAKVYIYNEGAIPFVEGSIVMGYNNTNREIQIDAGYFFCPYILLMSGGIVLNPVTHQPAAAFMTRYGKSVFKKDESVLASSHDYYAKLTIGDVARTLES